MIAFVLEVVKGYRTVGLVQKSGFTFYNVHGNGLSLAVLVGSGTYTSDIAVGAPHEESIIVVCWQLIAIGCHLRGRYLPPVLCGAFHPFVVECSSVVAQWQFVRIATLILSAH